MWAEWGRAALEVDVQRVLAGLVALGCATDHLDDPQAAELGSLARVWADTLEGARDPVTLMGAAVIVVRGADYLLGRGVFALQGAGGGR